MRAYSTLDDGEKLFGAYSDGKSGRAKNSRSEIEKIQSWGYSALKINWKPVQDAEGYRIYCKEPGKSWKYVTQVANGETVSYIHTGRITGRNYTYYIRAYRTLDGKKVFGAYSDGKSGKAVPKQVKITKAKAQKGKAVLAWNKVNGASGYRIYYKNSENGKWHYVTPVSYTHLHVLGVSQGAFEKMEFLGEGCTWEEFQSGNYVIVNRQRDIPGNYYHPGDTVTVELGEGREMCIRDRL